jgi:hypothetical protein
MWCGAETRAGERCRKNSDGLCGFGLNAWTKLSELIGDAAQIGADSRVFSISITSARFGKGSRCGVVGFFYEYA